jgi:metal-sulfur cluster biosynthetic enzyme
MTEQTAPVAPIHETDEARAPEMVATQAVSPEAPPVAAAASVESPVVESQSGNDPQSGHGEVTPQPQPAQAQHGADGECCGGDHGSVTTACPTEPATVSLDVNAAAPDELTLLGALKQVIDPELFVNVVDLGLIYAIHQDEGKVVVDMTLTSPACPAGPQLVQQAKQALEAVPGIKEATIKLVMTPPWSPDRMTDDARDHLGIF